MHSSPGSSSVLDMPSIRQQTTCMRGCGSKQCPTTPNTNTRKNEMHQCWCQQNPPQRKHWATATPPPPPPPKRLPVSAAALCCTSLLTVDLWGCPLPCWRKGGMGKRAVNTPHGCTEASNPVCRTPLQPMSCLEPTLGLPNATKCSMRFKCQAQQRCNAISVHDLMGRARNGMPRSRICDCFAVTSEKQFCPVAWDKQCRPFPTQCIHQPAQGLHGTPTPTPPSFPNVLPNHMCAHPQRG